MAGGYSKSPLAYGDIKELLDKALDSPRGIKITLEKHGHAIQLRQRASKFRTMDRASSKTVYPEGHPMHGRSSYDVLALRIKTGRKRYPVPTRAEQEAGVGLYEPPYVVIFERIDKREFAIEELTEEGVESLAATV
jgi:hypothetical protein